MLGIGFISCSKTSTSVGDLSLEESWQWQGFEDASVTALVKEDEKLLIGTESGLFQLKEDKFISLGLEDHEIRGVVRLKENSLISGVKASDFSSGDNTLFKSKNEGKDWEPFLNNFGGDENYTWLDRGPSAANSPSDTIFVRGNGSVIRSLNGGEHWDLVLGDWESYGGFAALLYIDPHHQGHIWAGGVNSLSRPYLYKSVDYGDNWTTVTDGLTENTETIVYDVITLLEDPDLVLAGLGGSIEAANNVRKSTDGGESWDIVLEETGVHAFARSIRNPEIIYASGRDSSTKLFFAVTYDFGETWEKEIFEEGPSPVTTHDISVMTIEGREVMFFGTDQGLFSYTFTE